MQFICKFHEVSVGACALFSIHDDLRGIQYRFPTRKVLSYAIYAKAHSRHFSKSHIQEICGAAVTRLVFNT